MNIKNYWNRMDNESFMGGIKVLLLATGSQIAVLITSAPPIVQVIVAILTFAGPILTIMVKHHLSTKDDARKAKALERENKILLAKIENLDGQVDRLSERMTHLAQKRLDPDN